jgi:hypothetical protein
MYKKKDKVKRSEPLDPKKPSYARSKGIVIPPKTNYNINQKEIFENSKEKKTKKKYKK